MTGTTREIDVVNDGQKVNYAAKNAENYKVQSAKSAQPGVSAG